jgi:hypothetical protein
MSPRDTSTGGVLESMIIPSLKRSGYHYRKGVFIGQRPGGGRYKADIVVWKDRKKIILISSKWQQVGGTAEQKVPFEIISLIKIVLGWRRGKKFKIKCEDCKRDFIIETNKIKPFLVLGGPGWTLKQFYLKGGLNKYMRYSRLVNIILLEELIAKINQRKL